MIFQGYVNVNPLLLFIGHPIVHLNIPKIGCVFSKRKISGFPKSGMHKNETALVFCKFASRSA